MPQLLVSVRDPAEARAALAAGADLIDVKDPGRGALGRPDFPVLAEVVSAVGGRVPVSAALGELIEWTGRDPAEFPLPEGVAFVKVGLTACDRSDWKSRLADLRRRVEQYALGPTALPKWIAVAYADQSWARSPAPLEVVKFAADHGFAGLLLDTWEKNENRLTDWIIPEELEYLVGQCRFVGMTVALAGSLGESEIRGLLPLDPDLFAVRGAVCRSSLRGEELDPARVARLREVIGAGPSAAAGRDAG
jgi:uncharacterized protein (UPF0264 family)